MDRDRKSGWTVLIWVGVTLGLFYLVAACAEARAQAFFLP